jgi:VanZ family protein
VTILLRILAALWILLFLGLIILGYSKWDNWSFWMKGAVILALVVLSSGLIEVFQFMLKGDIQNSN